MIEYSTKKLESLDLGIKPKPLWFEGKLDAPLDQLNDRSFEYITYFAIKQAIEQQGNWNGYEQIELLGGVRDKGMDCVFRNHGEVQGIIQCKHSVKGTPLGKTVVAKEILKFLLYSLQYPELVPNIDSFSYFLFPSAGLNSEARSFLEGFNDQISKHLHLKKWVNEVILQHASLSILVDFSMVKERLLPVLENIKVKLIASHDFRLLLSKPFNSNLIPIFFGVRSVLDENTFSGLLEKRLNPSLSYNEAHTLTTSASVDLSEVKAFFGVKPNTHVNRTESHQIVDWVLEDLPAGKKPLAVLEANGGLGKSVVLRDVYQGLKQKGIPVLAIKADRYYADGLVALEEKLFQKRAVGIAAVLSSLLQEQQKAVVLIDQLDALSLTLSTNRAFLTTYNRLITELLSIPGIRIVVSIRSFDLRYDADLRKYKSNEIQQFVLKPLTISEVKNVLSQHGLTIPSRRLLELLSIPNHLNTYCKISSATLSRSDQLKSLNDLHQTLWDDLIRDGNNNNLNVRGLLYSISKMMSEREQITVPNLFADSFSRELDFVKSRGIIFEAELGIQFFHQTFYDFCFSKQFVENGQSLTSYLNDKRQSLYVRPVVKMVSEYLRDYDPDAYIKALKKIVLGKRYRYHIKLLLLNSLGVQPYPNETEKSFVRKCVFPNPTYFDAFMTSVHSRGWMEFFIERNVLWVNLHPSRSIRHRLRNLLPNRLQNSTIVEDILGQSFDENKDFRANLVLRVLQNNHTESLDLVIGFLERFNSSKKFEGLAQNVLIQIEDWRNKRLLPLFEQYIPYNEDSETRHSNIWFYHLMEKISEHHLLFCITKLTPIIIKLFSHKHFHFQLSYELDKILKSLYEKYPQETFVFLFELMKVIVESNRKDHYEDETASPLYKALYFSDLHLVSSVSSNADEVLFELMRKHLVSQANKDPEAIKTFYAENKKSNAIPILKLCAVALEANPAQFHNLAYDFASIVHSKSGLDDWDNQFQYLIRKLIGSCFSYFSASQQEHVINIIFSVKHPRELSVFVDDVGKRHFINSTGKKQYLFLSAISEENLHTYPQLWKRFQELRRKFGQLKDRPMDQSRSVSYAVGGPLSSDAYAKMDLENWKNSMKKYGDDYVRDRSAHPSKGGKHEHAKAFKEQVQKRPGYFYPLVAEIAKSDFFSQDYTIYGIWGLIEGEFEAKKVVAIYKQLIQKGIADEHINMAIYFCQYITKSGLTDMDILKFLANLVRTLPNPEKIYNPDDLEHESLNTRRSAALIKMMHCNQNPDFEELIFKTVEEVAKDRHPTIQAAIMGHIAHLNHFNVGRSFAIFQKASETADSAVLACSIWSANFYLPNHFDQMQAYFAKILSYEELHEHGVALIAKSWVFEYGSDGTAHELLEKAYSAGEKAASSILNIAEHMLFKDNVLHPKSAEMMFRCLEIDGEDLSGRFSGLILRKFNQDNFLQVYPFLQSYLKTSHAQREPRYLLNLLTDCAQKYPVKCLNLMEMAIELGNGDIQKRGYLDREPVQVVLAIHSSLHQIPNLPKSAVDRTLNLFDRLLLDRRYRSHATNAIALI